MGEGEGVAASVLLRLSAHPGTLRGGEVLVSSVVHDLVAGPGIAFADTRDVELKGIEGTHRLYALA